MRPKRPQAAPAPASALPEARIKSVHSCWLPARKGGESSTFGPALTSLIPALLVRPVAHSSICVQGLARTRSASEDAALASLLAGAKALALARRAAIVVGQSQSVQAGQRAGELRAINNDDDDDDGGKDA